MFDNRHVHTKARRDSWSAASRQCLVQLLPWLLCCILLLKLGQPQRVCSTSTADLPAQPSHVLTPGSGPSWQLSADCSDQISIDYLRLLEGAIDPHELLRHLVQQKSRTWLQIGSNTMDNMNGNDPLKKQLNNIPTWKKVFVEPIPPLFKVLQTSIQRWPNSTAVNVALSPDREIAETKAQMWCYGAAFNSTRLGRDLPRWANQICSFNQSHIARHFKGQSGVPVEVTAISLENLLHRSDINSLEVLVIDTEGFDYEVLKQIPFDRLRPTFVLWEHKHLHGNRPHAETLMRNHCYVTKVLDMENTVAISLLP